MYKVTEKDLIGQLKGFPIEVVQKMVERQTQQGNPADVSVFQEDEETGRRLSGFAWSETKEGAGFWRKVIVKKNFDLFFERYPKQEQAAESNPLEPTYPCWMYVGDTKEYLQDKRKRFVLCKLAGLYIAISDVENQESEEELFSAMRNIGTCNWLYATPIPPKVKLTRAEIAKKLGIEPDFEIID